MSELLGFFVSNAYAHDASAAAATQPSMLASILPMLLIMAVFYLFIIRPQNKKLQEHKATINALKKGDQVITGGGIYGTIVKVELEKEIAQVEIADGVKVKVKLETIAAIAEKK